jgi:hypothetical protein
MRLTKSLIAAITTLTLTTGAAFAGEDSTHRWHGTGPEYHQMPGGLTVFSDADSTSSNRNEPELLSDEQLAESDVFYIYPMQVSEYYLLVPSVDTELAVGG